MAEDFTSIYKERVEAARQEREEKNAGKVKQPKAVTGKPDTTAIQAPGTNQEGPGSQEIKESPFTTKALKGTLPGKITSWTIRLASKVFICYIYLVLRHRVPSEVEA